MSVLFTLALFLGDALIVLVSGWLLALTFQARAVGMLEQSLAWLLAILLLVAASAVVLGEFGQLRAVGFLVLHGFTLVLLLVARRSRRDSDQDNWRRFEAGWRALFQESGAVRWATAALLLAMVLLGVLAALGEPLVYDALTYRLPRIGQWLQQGRIGPVSTDDARLNYMAMGQDLVVAWLVGAWPTGFQFASVAQTLGGALLIGSTVGLARRTGLSRLAALGAAALVLGLANVAPQMTSAHTDLFAAGIFSAAFYLWWMALDRTEGSLLGGAGFAYAVAAKGTVFYLVPSALAWMTWLAWRHRASLRAWVPTVLAAAMSAGLFLGPPFARNFQLYGHIAAPDYAMREHYGPPFSAAQRIEKLELNLKTALVQLLEPHSQPWGLRSAGVTLARRLAASLPTSDPYAFDALDRRANLQFFLAGDRPNADFATPGVPVVFFFVLGAAVSVWRWRKPDGRRVAAWSVGVVLYVLVQNLLLQWHPWAFRYSSLVAPWLVVVAVWWIELVPRLLRAVLWAWLLASGAVILTEATLEADQVGWQAWQVPRENGALAQGWRQWAQNLGEDTPALRIALIGDRPLAWFFRLDPAVSVQMASRAALPVTTAEAAVTGTPGWLVVPATMYSGREGRVMARTWLSRGAAADDLSLAAYRSLRAGEMPVPAVYQNITRLHGSGFQCDLQLRSWQNSVRLEMVNPAESNWNFVIQTGNGEVRGTVAAHADIFVVASAANDRLTKMTIDYMPSTTTETRARPPVIVAVHPPDGGP